MTNIELENRLGELVKRERETTREMLFLIREAERRRLHVERGFSNPYDWLVETFRISRGAAHRRIQAARLLECVPEVEAKYASGELNLTVLAQVQSAFQREEKKTGESVSKEFKEEILARVEGKAAEKVERILAEEFPESAKPKESLRATSAEDSKLTVTINEEAVCALKRLRELLLDAMPGASYAEIVSHALIQEVKRTDPLQSAANARRIRILKRAGGQCEFTDEKSNRRCSAREHLEIDHIQPKALGGTDEDANLRILCRQHNLLEAERIFGKEKMNQYRRAT